MKITVILPGSIRSKKNSKRIYGMGKFKKVLPSKAYLAWEEKARLLVLSYLSQTTNFDMTGWKHVNVSVNAQIFFKGPQLSLIHI